MPQCRSDSLGGAPGLSGFEFQPTMLHTKLVLIDDRWSIIGSANFDNRSFALNDEVILVVDDANLASALSLEYQADLALSRPVSIDGPSRWTTALGHLALLLREQL